LPYFFLPDDLRAAILEPSDLCGECL